jgi:type I restriction enzyme S subunit
LAVGIERFVGLEHIEPEDLRIRRWGFVADGTTFTNRFRPGQVLFGKRRAYQRKVAMAEFESTEDWTANRKKFNFSEKLNF